MFFYHHGGIVHKLDRSSASAHLLALLAVAIWGLTFVSAKVLLDHFSPLEVLVLRFFLAWLVLLILHPRFRFHGWRDEFLVMGLGLSGVSAYFFAENYALTLSPAANVSLLVATAPLFTALLVRLTGLAEKVNRWVIIGGTLALLGTALVMAPGLVAAINPLGDILALVSALSWAVYSVLLKRLKGSWGMIELNQRVFFYGLLSSMPFLLIPGMGSLASLDQLLESLAKPLVLLNLLFLGLGASALSYVIWGRAIKILGVIRTSAWIYLIPLIAMASSALLLGETITPVMALGGGLILAGTFLSERS